jgi:beta-glucosidase
VSDCAAIRDIYQTHKKVPDAAAGVALAIKAGTDLDCGVEFSSALAAVRQGLLAEADVNQSLKRLLLARFRLGMFDPPSMVKYTQIPLSENDSSAHRALAAETARKSIVLLKNEGRLLPLSKSLKTIAVIGPNADDAQVQLGNYNGIPSSLVTPLDGIRKKLGSGTRVLYAKGSDVAPGMPAFEVIPSSVLFTSNGQNKQNGLTGQYFNSGNFDGKLHRPAELTYPSSGKLSGQVPANPTPLFSRVDPQINFEWGEDAPRAGMNEDDFGVRWTGFLSAPVSGSYQLGTIGMNAFELYLDGKELVSTNTIHSFAYQYAPVQLEAGKLYEIRLDYHEFANFAGIQLVWSRPGGPLEQEAIDAAKQADAVVLVAGLSPRLEGEEMKVAVPGFEGGDRVLLGLPKVQEELIQKITALGKPTVLVLLNGSAVAINWARDHVPAIVETWYPGEEGGTAIADVVFGDYNPAGRLPVTFYKSADQLPPFSDYSMKGKTYRYFTGEPLFPFGFGLSYTAFAYKNMTVPKQVKAGAGAMISVDVTNTGSREGDEVVQVYLKSPAGTPIRTLVGFERVALKPGETRSVSFSLRPRDFSKPTGDGHFEASPGVFEISVGGKQPGFKGAADASTTATISGRLRVTGPAARVN